MAMLAEKRRKTKWILNPRSNQWSDDSSKFGQRLMEKMGWKAGNGLGINQQGGTENVKVTVRSDNRGVGFKDRPEDVLPHQDDFAELLLQLGNASNDAQAGSDAVETRETSLEAKSQKSRSRVHYHKFTRGKDLSRYSAKDLECILGKKSNETLPTPAVSTAIPESDVVTIVRGNMVDYFKDKKKNMSCSWPKAEETDTTMDNEMEERPSFGFGFNPVLDKSHTADDELEERPSFGFGFKPVSEKSGEDLEKDAVKEDSEDGKVEKREKKRSKKIKNVETIADDTPLTEPVENDVQPKLSKKEQKKSKKTATTDDVVDLNVGVDLHNSTEVCKKEKKVKKKANNAEVVTIGENTVEDLQDRVDENKMEKKRKSKRTNVVESLVEKQEIQDEDLQESAKSRKKEKKAKSKKTNVEDEGTVDEVQDVSEVSEKKKKRKAKKESAESNDDDIALENNEKRKKKGKMDQSENTIPSNEILSDNISTVVAPSEQPLSKKKKRKHDITDKAELPSSDNDVSCEINSKESTGCETEETPDKAEHKEKKSKKRKHMQDKEENETSAEPKKKRRKSVTFSEELFEVVLIPPREELATDSDDEEDEKSDDQSFDVGTSGDSANNSAIPDLIQIVDGKRYVNGILEVEAPIRPARIFKTDAAKRIKFDVRGDAFDSFPGSNVHMLGYAGLNIKQPHSIEYPAK